MTGFPRREDKTILKVAASFYILTRSSAMLGGCYFRA